MRVLLFQWFLLITIQIINATSSIAQQQQGIEWAVSYGGASIDVGNSIQLTSDGGYVAIGKSRSSDGDITVNHGREDYWVVKISSDGSIQWQKSFGGSSEDNGRFVQGTSDGGYILIGFTMSNDGDVIGNHGGYDCWVVKLDSIGDIEWQRALGGSGMDAGVSIIQTSDGGYAMISVSDSNDEDVYGNNGQTDFWVVKLSELGNIEWQKSLGGSSSETASSIQQTADGGYIVSGQSSSNDGDVTGNHGDSDFWIVKLSSFGDIQWQNSYGGAAYDHGLSIQETADGGYITCGFVESNNGNVTFNHGSRDVWVLKLSNNGDLEWEKSFGGTGDDWGHEIQITSDGGYVILGHSNSNDGDVFNIHGSRDYWAIKLSNFGVLEWQKTLGGSESDIGHSIRQTLDGGFILIGESQSNDGDVTGNHGASDYWIVKLNATIGLSEFSDFEWTIVSPNPVTSRLTIKVSLTNSEDLQVYIRDLLGHVVLEPIKFNNVSGLVEQSISTTMLSDGMYLLDIVGLKWRKTKRIIIVQR